MSPNSNSFSRYRFPWKRTRDKYYTLYYIVVCLFSCAWNSQKIVFPNIISPIGRFSFLQINVFPEFPIAWFLFLGIYVCSKTCFPCSFWMLFFQTHFFEFPILRFSVQLERNTFLLINCGASALFAIGRMNLLRGMMVYFCRHPWSHKTYTNST